MMRHTPEPVSSTDAAEDFIVAISRLMYIEYFSAMAQDFEERRR